MSRSYDQIAAVYATDMGQSMPFDDIGWYRQLALAAAGPVLELGCGSGRILLPLLAAGVDIVGVDRSLPMLQQLRRDAGVLQPRIARMDLNALALRAQFALILAPYSLITYLTTPASVDQLLDALRSLLRADGQLVLDAFIPQPVSSFEDFRRDYLRPHAGGTLERAKRIRALADGCNRIERRYTLRDAAGAETECFTTVDVIRPYAADTLRTALTRQGYRIVRESLDYDTRHDGTPRFASLIGRLPPLR